MQNTYTNCIRCGKARVVLSQIEEKVGTSVIFITESVCPDPDCQKKVDAMFGDEKAKRAASALEKEERDRIRKQKFKKE